MRIAVKSHALPVYKKNRIASLLCIFETTIVTVDRITMIARFPFSRNQVCPWNSTHMTDCKGEKETDSIENIHF